MSITRQFILAAGGTGGHMVPAHALAGELMRRGHRVALVTDERGRRIPGLFGDVEVHVMPAGRMAGGPLGWFKAWESIRAGRTMARRLYRDCQPTAVVGFGGYPALPALLAALDRGIATAVHEQNAVLGRVNRLLARRVDAIATAYPDVERLKPRFAGKVALVGNPVREEVKAIGRQRFPDPGLDGPLRLLVTGGSQGATILSTVVPEGLGLLPPELRDRIEVVQQCRPDDIERVRATYTSLGIKAELATYLEDLPAVLAASHLVVARAGASTIAELTVAGRPAILVPLPSAMDDHQTVNAREMTQAGGARTIVQRAFTPKALADAVVELAGEPEALIAAAAHARACGRPGATEALADLVEGFGRTPVMDGLPVRKKKRGRRPAAPRLVAGSARA
ncbi:undecaprenyldiphospho-muramoylpentapeptide beta-N-acetylglucosaminyltransferase [Sphingomonas nostoxanthinifaciens]|uniref:undecaprenyldiphospho-muramoylpentapeptide beta-N-acetylglucosaminyltransferase n=1 Tax=Sphingomonas nostoxanthinifaciens TaxID=2872652 RepID=UPI001CC22021|nr:undecaprenyldiphospho-muramoylpentapeptide beta-N-acetylglucosaminyltransferase [Sphingomonas nostoxanthinifaciens]UAK24941.1 undecaprenyldiphospho-muramoylpentapeptide beta-N-acetylglucosaminyltransferase [Sphingomonas nostoxanthinifaciens]